MARAGDIGRDLFEVAPAAGSGRVAVRAGLVMLVALLVLWASGHLDHALYATFGAFATVYGGTRPYPGRWQLQTRLGLVLTGAVCVGAVVGVSDHRAWWSIPVTALAAGAAAWWSDRERWRPPGPLFVVFAVGACSAVPGTFALVLSATLVAAGTAGLAVLLGLLDAQSLSRSYAVAEPPEPPAPPPGRQWLHAGRCVAAVALAGGSAAVLETVSGVGHPYWAMVAAVAPLSVFTLQSQLSRGLLRLLGTIIGIGLAGLLLWLPLSSLVTVLLVALLQASAELFVTRNYGLALIAITTLALLVGHLAAPAPVGPLLLDRVVQTALGVLVGVAAAVLTRARVVDSR